MRYYSDVCNKVYDTEAELAKAEAEVAEKKAAAEKAKKEKELALKAKNEKRAERAKAVEDAYKKSVEARKNYEKVLADFCKDYGAYHTTLKSEDLDNMLDILDAFKGLRSLATWPF